MSIFKEFVDIFGLQNYQELALILFFFFSIFFFYSLFHLILTIFKGVVK